MMDLATGQILRDRYRVVNKLAQGGFGAVYRAWDMNLRNHCAVKENLNASEAVREQFMREAKILSGLTHPHLPRVTDYFFIPGQGQYLVMDYIEGLDLQEMLDEKGEPLPQGKAMQWVYQVCDAMMYLHSQQPPIIHRDIKPANIKVAPDGRAVLVDFGIAKIFDAKSQTVVGAKAVTPGFSPPEQYGKGSTDVRSDVYSLGATLYALLTGEAPPSSVDVISKIVPPPPPARMRNPAVSPEVSDAIVKAMQMEKQARFPSIAEFRDALSKPAMATVKASEPVQPGAYATYPTSVPAQPPYATVSPEPTRKRSPILAILLAGLFGTLLVGALVVGGIWLLNPDFLGGNGDDTGSNATQTAEWLSLRFTQTVLAAEESFHATETARFVPPPVVEPTEPPPADEPTPMPTPGPTFTSPPEPSPTTIVQEGPVLLTDLNFDKFYESDEGCYKDKGPCLIGLQGDKKILIEDLYIDPSWPNPYLVFRTKYEFPEGAAAVITVLVGSAEDILKQYAYGEKVWYEEKLSLAKYSGKTITIKFFAPWGASIQERRGMFGYRTINKQTQWSIQDLRIETDYQP